MRYVVETINGHLKTRFQYFNHLCQIQFIPYLLVDFRNAAAIHNAFNARLISDVDDVEVISNLMLTSLDETNKLGQLVSRTNLNRSKNLFRSITDLQLPEFPILTERDLYLVASGHTIK